MNAASLRHPWMRSGRGAAVLLMVWACCSALPAQESPPAADAPLPKLSALPLPSAETLLREKPFDWVVLKDTDEVLVVEPVSPRPDTLEKLEAEYLALGEERPKTKERQDEVRQRRIELRKLVVTLVGAGEDSDFTVDTKFVNKIIYHEDLVLRRVSQCIDEDLTATAFELLVYLDRRHPNWPGYKQQVNRLLLREARLQFTRGQLEAALQLAEELYDRDSAFPGLADLAGQIVDRLMTQAMDKKDYRRARHFLGRLARREAKHAVVERRQAELLSLSQASMDSARAASGQGDGALASTLIDEAAHVWPETPGLRDVHRELTNRYPVLRVGVLHLPSENVSYPFRTRAQERARQLTTIHWFETTRYDERGARHDSIPCEGWEPDDLGREIRFELRRNRAEWETRPLFTSATLATALSAQLDPQGTDYNERMAAVVAGVTTPSPFEFTVRFRRPPLRPEALFHLPLSAGAESPDLSTDGPDHPNDAGIRFRQLACDERACRFIRYRAEPENVKQRHVAEIREQRYDDWDHLIQGLQRGEISAIPHINPLDLASLKDDPRFFVLPYAQPTSHLIQIHPRSKPLQNGQLRRALLHGIQRDTLLTESFLAGVPKDLGIARLTASPFTLASAAYNRLLTQPTYDLILSAGLAATARKEFGGTLPPLKITRPPDVEIARVVDALIEGWKRIGIEVVIADSADDAWDLAYRTVQFREPLVELWPFLLVDPAATMAGLEILPEGLRRQFLEIERATDWNTANGLLHRLQIDLLIDARWIPLWEADEFLLVRKNVTGLPERPVHPYQGIERWIVQSWYPTETP